LSFTHRMLSVRWRTQRHLPTTSFLGWQTTGLDWAGAVPNLSPARKRRRRFHGEIAQLRLILIRNGYWDISRQCVVVSCGDCMCVTVQTKSNFVVKVLLNVLNLRRFTMNMNIAIEPILALVIGILILLVPRFLNYFVAVYLIVRGILGLMHQWKDGSNDQEPRRFGRVISLMFFL